MSVSGIDLDAVYESPSRNLVLVVDDDPDTTRLLKLTLRSAGLDVMGALSGYEALRKCADVRPDLVLLDIMMPEVDGWETFRRLRHFADIPVVVVSARSNKDEIVAGLESGVDDYVVKPFHPDEVVARVRAVLRRSREQSNGFDGLVFPQQDLVLHWDTRQALVKGERVDLSPKEFELLMSLARRAPQPVAYHEIAEEIWGADSEASRNRIKYLIFQLRQKLEADPSEPVLIVNRLGFGYQLDSEPGGSADYPPQAGPREVPARSEEKS